MASGRRGALTTVFAVAVAALTGCAGIPDHGAVHVGRALPAAGGVDQGDVHIVPHGPVSGMSATDVVHGFLRSMVDNDGSYAIARTFLTPRAAASWRSAGVTTYDDSDVRVIVNERTTSATTVALRAPRVGYVDARGDFTPSVGAMNVSFTLVKQAHEWRIDRLPAGALVSAYDALRSYRLADVYYLNRTGTALVPEQVLLQPSGITTALVRTLLDGPGGWIAPAVRTAFPTGAELVGNVPVDPSGVAEVNFSAGIRQASAGQLRALSAQLVWTLRQVSAISAVRLLADGSPLVVPGAATNQPRDAWASFNPTAAPTVSVALCDVGGGSVAAVGGHLRGLDQASPLRSPVLSHDGRVIAGLRPDGRRMQLWLGTLGSAPTRRLTSSTLTAPTFDAFDNAFTVATGPAGRRLIEVGADGHIRLADADATLLRQPVQALRVSRDGARVAALLGPAGAARLYVGRVEEGRDRARFAAFRPVLFGVTDVRGVTWSAAGEVLVTASVAPGTRSVVKVDPDGYDGYAPVTVDTGGVAGSPTDVTALGSAMVVEASGGLWQRVGADWRRVGSGSTPAFAD